MARRGERAVTPARVGDLSCGEMGRTGVWMRRGVGRLAPAAIALVAVAGCSGGSSSSSSTSSSTTATIGASSSASPHPTASVNPKVKAKEEATAALSRYGQVVDRVFQSGGQLKDELSTVAVAHQLTFLRQQADFLVERKQKQVGKVRYAPARSVTITASTGLATSATIVVCTDFRGRLVVDTSGRNVLPPNMPEVFLTTFTLANTKPGNWLVAGEQDQQVKRCT